MTFKHTKFEDSPTMRSLEKIAKDKGLVKESSPVLEKKASVQNDTAPSGNLTSNIMKLCAGLRKAGLDTYAADVETKFLNYKQAQTLYDTHGEKGEDLIHDAHPKGSHKLEGVEGDEATFEDILERHLKMTEVATKAPKGKLASDRAIQAVKNVLGQAVAPKKTESQLYKEMNDILNLIPSQMGQINARVKKYGDSEWATIDKGKADELSQAVSAITTNRPFTKTNLFALKAAWTKYITWASDTGAFEDSVLHSGAHNEQSAALWENNVGPWASNFATSMWKVENRIRDLETIELMKQDGTYKEPTPEAPKGTVSLPTFTRPGNEVVTKAYPLIQLCDQYVSAANIAAPWLNDKDRSTFIAWLGRQKIAIQAIWSKANTSDESEFSQIKDMLMNRLNSLASELQEGYNTYLVQT